MKKLYIYEGIDKITTMWHDCGSLVIITDGDPQEAWTSRENPSNDERTDLPEPNRVIDVSDSEADAIYIFADAGCC